MWKQARRASLKLPKGTCATCQEEKQVHNVFGFALCDECDKKSSPSKNTKAKNIEKKQKKKVKKIIQENETTQTIYVVGTPKEILSEAKTLRKKETKYNKRSELYDTRKTKLEAKIKRLEEKKEKLGAKILSVHKSLSDADFLEQDVFKNRKIESFGKTGEGGERVKMSGKWFVVPPHLIGEKQTMTEIVRHKEKEMTRKVMNKIEGV